MAIFNIAAGHGGSDPGATFKSRKESQDNLKLALAVEAELIKRGHKVNQYRKDETVNCSASACREWLGKTKADFSIVFHRNAFNGSANGIEVWSFDKSTQISAAMSAAIAKAGGFYNRGRKGNGAAWLNSSVPCCEPEVGFIDNASDNTKFDNNFNAIVIAIVDTLEAYFGKGNITKAKTYEVVKTINKYATAADAKVQASAKGTFTIGTYYIYNKYPEGYQGMFNLTTDSTGNTPNAWINPNENIEEKPIELYRVRKSADDAKSQIGAYSSLENAKKACDEAGEGYKVFDSDYNIVYEYKTLVTEPKKVYELDYPEKNPIVDKTINRTNEDCVKAIKLILSNNKDFDIEIAKVFFKLAPVYGIDPLMAIAQSIIETGWFKYVGSAVKPEHHNYCGLGVTINGKHGVTFSTIEKGVSAQLQHLFAYGSKDTLNETIVDPRFKYVTRGIAPYWQQLAGRWAVPGYADSTPEEAMKNGNTYGQKIRVIYNILLNTNINTEDVEKYFPTEQKNDIINNIDLNKEVPKIIKLLKQIFDIISSIWKHFNNKGE